MKAIITIDFTEYLVSDAKKALALVEMLQNSTRVARDAEYVRDQIRLSDEPVRVEMRSLPAVTKILPPQGQNFQAVMRDPARYFRPFCLHGETDTTDGTCLNLRLPGPNTAFCAEHTPPARPRCACGSLGEHLQRFRIVSRDSRTEPEDDFVCEECLRNEASRFEFTPLTATLQLAPSPGLRVS
jgi:hypothetical protein